MSNIKVRVAVESDADAILKLLREHFYPEEPLTIALEPFQQDDEDEQFMLSWIKYGTCLIAYYDNDNNSTSVSTATTAATIATRETCNSTNSSTIQLLDNFEMTFPNHEARNQHNNNQIQKAEQNTYCECNNNQYQKSNQHNFDHQQNQIQQCLKCVMQNEKLNSSEISLNDDNTKTVTVIQQQLLQQNCNENSEQIIPVVIHAELLGAIIAGPKYPGEAEHLLNESEKVKSVKWSNILKLFSHLESKANVFEHFNCQSALHSHAVVVHPNARGKSIGFLLLKKLIEICKELQYPVLTLDCTSMYSMIHLARTNMQCLYEMKFSDFRNDRGEQVFYPPPPHTMIKTFGKKINFNDDDD